MFDSFPSKKVTIKCRLIYYWWTDPNQTKY